MLNAGARIRQPHSNYFRNGIFFRPASSQRPCLVGLTKEEALAYPGSSVADLFIYTPPRFLFSRSQRILRAMGALTFLTNMGLFIGQSPAFFAYMRQLAHEADHAHRGGD